MIMDEFTHIVTIPNRRWLDNGGSILAWLGENFPDNQYRYRFRKSNKGMVIPEQPVDILFTSVEAATMFKLALA